MTHQDRLELLLLLAHLAYGDAIGPDDGPFLDCSTKVIDLATNLNLITHVRYADGRITQKGLDVVNELCNALEAAT